MGLYHQYLFCAIAQAVKTLASQIGSTGLIPEQVIHDLWYTKWHWGELLLGTLLSTTNFHSISCPIH
jgi:hypothetical protein